MVQPDKLREICRTYSGDGYYCGQAIPATKLANARAALGIPPGDEVFALVDLTLFGSAKDAIIVASSGVYAKNVGAPLQHFSWEALSSLSIRGSRAGFSASDVTFSDGRIIECAGGGTIVNSVIVPLLTALNTRKMPNEESSPPMVQQNVATGETAELSRAESKSNSPSITPPVTLSLPVEDATPSTPLVSPPTSSPKNGCGGCLIAAIVICVVIYILYALFSSSTPTSVQITPESVVFLEKRDIDELNARMRQIVASTVEAQMKYPSNQEYVHALSEQCRRDCDALKDKFAAERRVWKAPVGTKIKILECFDSDGNVVTPVWKDKLNGFYTEDGKEVFYYSGKWEGKTVFIHDGSVRALSSSSIPTSVQITDGHVVFRGKRDIDEFERRRADIITSNFADLAHYTSAKDERDFDALKEKFGAEGRLWEVPVGTKIKILKYYSGGFEVTPEWSKKMFHAPEGNFDYVSGEWEGKTVFVYKLHGKGPL